MPEEPDFLTSSLNVADVSKILCLAYVQAGTAPKALIQMQVSRCSHHTAPSLPAAPGGGRE